MNVLDAAKLRKRSALYPHIVDAAGTSVIRVEPTITSR